MYRIHIQEKLVNKKEFRGMGESFTAFHCRDSVEFKLNYAFFFSQQKSLSYERKENFLPQQQKKGEIIKNEERMDRV